MSEDRENVEHLAERLAAPFAAEDVKFKPAVVSGNRAMALAYVDARTIQDRLDEVLGSAGWQDEYEFLPDGSALCRLRCRFGDEWITKMDVGGESEQSDEGDRRKAAISDALKRAAVKFGVGRYLYRLPSQWVDYDPQKRQFKGRPVLPAVATARRKGPQPAAVIDRGQAQVVLSLIKQTGTDPHKFCNAYKIDSPEHLPADKYADAEAKLRRKLGRKDEGQGRPRRQTKAEMGQGKAAPGQVERIARLFSDLDLAGDVQADMLREYGSDTIEGLDVDKAALLLTKLDGLLRRQQAVGSQA